MFKAENNKVIGVSDSRNNETVVNLSKNLIHMPNIKATKEPIFPTVDIKKIFIYL